jgi:hypothetical protein
MMHESKNRTTLHDKSKRTRFSALILILVTLLLSSLYLSFAWDRYQKIAASEAVVLAQSLESLLHFEHIEKLSGGVEDIQKPEYIITKRSLMQLVETTNPIHFAYVLEERAGEISRLALVVDETQRWQQSRSPLPLADGLFDVDFEISPVTNSLSIRRLNLKVGESAQSTAVWVRFPGLRLERLRQRYTRIDDTRYRYEAPELGFTSQLEVDKAGLIVKYGDLWMRIA